MTKKILEVIVCIFHPVAVILAWINLSGRSDLETVTKILWAVFLLVPIIPVFYVLFSGDLW
jgi:hypothetical protein